MKKIGLFLLFMMLAVIAGTLANAQYLGESPKVQVTLIRQEPDPVEPGQQIEVTFKFDNNGSTAYGIVAEIIPEYPFSLLPGENSVKNVGILSSSQGGERSVIIKYKLKVDSQASDGTHELGMRFKSDNYDSWIKLDDFKISVRTQDPVVSLEKFSTSPETTAPGKKLILRMDLKNYATSLIKNIKVSLNLGTGTSAMPFAPVSSTDEKIYPLLQPQEILPLEFNLLVDPDAVSKVYKVPVTIKYSDNLNKNYSKTLNIAIVVGDEPDTSVYIEDTDIYSAGKNGDVAVKIVNKGVTELKFLNVNLNKADGYKVLSPTNVYIGNVDSDDYETVDFKIAVDAETKGKIALPLTLEYKDTNNRDYKKNVNLELPLYTSSEAKKLGLVKNGSSMTIVIVIAAIVALFVAYRLWRRRSK